MADAITAALKRQGWTAIPFPNSSFRLLTLVFERGGARGHSNDFEYLAPGVAGRLPVEDIDQVPDISGDRSQTRDLSLGISILSGLISALGGGTLGLKLGFKNADKVTMSYAGLSAQAISPVALQHSLSRVPAPTGGLLRDWLDDNLYVATSVLSAKKILIDATKTSGQEAALDVPVISGAVGGNVKVTAGNETKSKVIFESDRPAPIALVLYEINKIRSGGAEKLTLDTIKQGQVDIKAAGHEDAPPEPAILDWDVEA
jgi:hypothetical protein